MIIKLWTIFISNIFPTFIFQFQLFSTFQESFPFLESIFSHRCSLPLVTHLGHRTPSNYRLPLGPWSWSVLPGSRHPWGKTCQGSHTWLRMWPEQWRDSYNSKHLCKLTTRTSEPAQPLRHWNLEHTCLSQTNLKQYLNIKMTLDITVSAVISSFSVLLTI